MITKLIGFGDELFERICPCCRNDFEVCNFCKFIPIDPRKHKHIFNCEEQILDLDMSWFKKLIGKSNIKIIKSCICGEIKHER